VGRILGEGVADQRRFTARGRQQHLDLGDPALDELGAELLRQLAPGIGEHFAGLRVACGKRQNVVAALAIGGRQLVVTQVDGGEAGEDPDLGHADMAHLGQAVGGQFLAQTTERIAALVLRVGDVGRQHRADDLAPLLPRVGPAGDVEFLLGEEEPQDVGIGAVAERPEQRRRRELLLLVDVDVDHVMDVDRELDPRAPERDDPRAE